LKGRAKRKRTSVKASNEILAPKENIRISVPSDVIDVEIVSFKLHPTYTFVLYCFITIVISNDNVRLISLTFMVIAKIVMRKSLFINEHIY
jgi:hypothetical protein